MKFKGFQMLQLPSTFVLQPLVNSTHCVQERFADVAIHSCHSAQDCGFFVLHLIFFFFQRA